MQGLIGCHIRGVTMGRPVGVGVGPIRQCASLCPCCGARFSHRVSIDLRVIGCQDAMRAQPTCALHAKLAVGRVGLVWGLNVDCSLCWVRIWLLRDVAVLLARSGTVRSACDVLGYTFATLAERAVASLLPR